MSGNLEILGNAGDQNAGDQGSDPSPTDVDQGTSRRTFLAAGAVAAGAVFTRARPGPVFEPAPGGEANPGAVNASAGSKVTHQALGRGTVTRGAQIDVAKGTDVFFDSVGMGPGGTTGWHSHPGPELIVVTKGTLTFQRTDGLTCVTEEVAAGQAFVGAEAGEIHAAHNHGSDQVQFVVAFFDIPVGGSPRSEADPPLACP